MRFGEDFVWGTATSSYQIEGAAYEDGKGLNIWDVFSKEAGKVFNGHSGDVACDHYHKYEEDVQLIKEMGIKAYRFSIDWARVLPNGVGEVNEKGIEFYSKLIDKLIENNIEPYVMLCHWELPYELHKQGGWLNENIVNWFGDFAALVAERFSDKVKYFLTLNEPQCIVALGYGSGIHAPGLKLGMKDSLQIAHNILKAHGQAVIELRKHAKGEIKIGYAPTGGMCYPATESEKDIEAARTALFSIPDCGERWAWNTSWFSDPVFLGKYPEEGLVKFKEYLPKITKEDMELISQPLDFMGQNIYNGGMVKAGKNGELEFVERPVGYARTANHWPITPKCLYWGSKFIYERYKLPLYITENGMSCHDIVSLDGKVHDPNRIDFLNRYLIELKRALEDGVNIKGYFVWSLMDNFEWDLGYSERFGLVHVDYETQARIIKDSGYWYKRVIESNGDNL